MRPVNLMPPEQRREGGVGRTGKLPYLVVGALALAVAAVGLYAWTGKQVSDGEAEVAQLRQDEAAAQAKAEALGPFAEFAAAKEAREATIASLARSRFDWERVLDELSRVLPDDVWLVSLSGTVSPEVAVPNETETDLRSDVPGPALSIIGCGRSQEAVAGFLAALGDIDGVTRVTVERSELPTGIGSAGADADCRTRKFISRFVAVAAFDAVPPPLEDGAEQTTPVVPGDGGVAEASAETEQAAAEATASSEQSQEVINETVPGAGG